jgi:hypothetical protein
MSNINWTEIAARVLQIVGADFLAAKIRNSGGETPPDSYLRNHGRYIAAFTETALQNAALAFGFKSPEAVEEAFGKLVTNPHTGKQVNLYALEKAAQWLTAWSKNTFSPVFCDKYTLAVLASMSRNGYSMNTRTMQGACCNALREKTGESFALRFRLHKGASTASTQVSSTCNMLHAFGFAQYDGHTLIVRESDRFTRKAIAALDAMDDAALAQCIGACASSTRENG